MGSGVGNGRYPEVEGGCFEEADAVKTAAYEGLWHSDSNSPIVSNKSDLSIFDFLIFYWFK